MPNLPPAELKAFDFSKGFKSDITGMTANGEVLEDCINCILEPDGTIRRKRGYDGKSLSISDLGNTAWYGADMFNGILCTPKMVYSTDVYSQPGTVSANAGIPRIRIGLDQTLIANLGSLRKITYTTDTNTSPPTNVLHVSYVDAKAKREDTGDITDLSIMYDVTTLGERLFGFGSKDLIFGPQGDVFFSQVGSQTKFYAEDPNSIVADDGGYFTIQGFGQAYAIRSLKNSVFAFADNGIWQITGASEGAFSATDYQVKKVYHDSILSKYSITQYKNNLVFLTKEGITVLSLDEAFGNVTFKTVQNLGITKYLDSIPEENIGISKLIYCEGLRSLFWLHTHKPVLEYQTWGWYGYSRMLRINMDTGGTSIFDLGTYYTDNDGYILPVDAPVLMSMERGSNSTVPMCVFFEGTANTVKPMLTVPFEKKEDDAWPFINFTNSWKTYNWTSDAKFSTYDLTFGDTLREKNIMYLSVVCEKTEEFAVTTNDPEFKKESGLTVRATFDANTVYGSKYGDTDVVYHPYQYESMPNTFKEKWLTNAKYRGVGTGWSIKLTFESEDHKDFKVHGFHMMFQANKE